MLIRSSPVPQDRYEFAGTTGAGEGKTPGTLITAKRMMITITKRHMPEHGRGAKGELRGSTLKQEYLEPPKAVATS